MYNLDKAKSIDGWMSDGELEFLASKAKHSKLIVEVGCYKGRSLRALADNSPKDAIIHAVDPWHGDYYDDNNRNIVIHKEYQDDHFEECKKHLEDHLSSCKIIIHRKKFEDFKLNFNSADLVFIDGDHHYKEVMKDIYQAQKITALNGIIAGHDYGRKDWPGVKKAVDNFFGIKVNIIDTIWWTRK